MVNSKEDDETDDTDSDRHDKEEESVLEVIGREGDEHTEDKSDEPDGNGTELGLDWAVAVFADDGGRKISESVGRDEEAEVHDSGSDELGDVRFVYMGGRVVCEPCSR